MDAKNRKRAQSEAVGFILIVLIVVIVGVIFLGITLRKDRPLVTIDAEISNFIGASRDYTSDCAIGDETKYRKLEQLVQDCYSNRQCLDGRPTCNVLNDTYSVLLENFMPGGTIEYAKLAFSFQNSINESEEAIKNTFFEIIQGDFNKCKSKRGGISDISAQPGNILVELEICQA